MHRMLATLAEIDSAIRGAWGADTTYATDEYLARGAGRPSRGQCGSTALVLHDLLGGALMIADVEHAGTVDGVHYWNRLPSGLEVDLTREQFLPHEALTRPRAVERRAELPGPDRARAAYLLLRGRVLVALDPGARASPEGFEVRT
jgi:hypothetical protein